MSLRSFLGEMHKKQQMLEISEEVSPKFEISAFMKEFDGGSILYFDNVKGKETKIVANVCGTRQRLCWALSVKPDSLYQKLLEAWRSPSPPKKVKGGPVNEVVERARLSKLPILTHFENDAGPYITSAVVYACSSDKKIENLSIHRLQVLDDNHLAIRLVPRHLFKSGKWLKKKSRTLMLP
jgi:2,5-furandicarboxylate decarboxylase 1